MAKRNKDMVDMQKPKLKNGMEVLLPENGCIYQVKEVDMRERDRIVAYLELEG
jgi:hypothetical protein